MPADAATQSPPIPAALAPEGAAAAPSPENAALFEALLGAAVDKQPVAPQAVPTVPELASELAPRAPAQPPTDVAAGAPEPLLHDGVLAEPLPNDEAAFEPRFEPKPGPQQPAPVALLVDEPEAFAAPSHVALDLDRSEPALSTARTTTLDLETLAPGPGGPARSPGHEARPAPVETLPTPALQSAKAEAQPVATELAPAFEPPVRREARATAEPTFAAVEAGIDPGLDLSEAQQVREAGEPQSPLLDDAEPLAGSVKLRGLRGARVAVDMGDGEVVRGRVDVQDGEIDVRLKASEATARTAEVRAGELRESLDNKGLRLGRYEVEVEAETEGEREHRNPERDERHQRQRRWQQPEDERGSFLNRRA